MFLGCLGLVQITKASTGENQQLSQDYSTVIPFPEDPLQQFECCSDSNCSDFFQLLFLQKAVIECNY